MTPTWRTRCTTLAVLVVSLLLAAGPAWADGAGPTRYVSQVLEVTPAVDEVEFAVVGGDTFLEVRVDPGHTVTVMGYGRGDRDQEPYLRIEADGTVLANLNSPAYYLNQDRYAEVDVPRTASVDAEPRWEPVGDGGVHRWHDHRIHWMSPGLPRAVERNPGDRVLVQPWTVPLEVDDQPVEVAGELYWLTSESPLLPLAVAVLGAAAVAVLWRSAPSRAAPLGALAAAIVATVVAAGQAAAPGVAISESALSLLPPVVGIGLAGWALTRSGRDRAQTALVAVAAVLVWAVPRASVTILPVLPGPLPDVVSRVGIAFAAGAALAAAVVAATALRPDATSGSPAGDG